MGGVMRSPPFFQEFKILKQNQCLSIRQIQQEVVMKQRTMKLSVAAVAALGCMGSSAFAMEHEFNGLLRIKADFTNFESGWRQ